MHRRALFTVLVLAPAIAWSGEDVYSAGPTWGTVIDRDTKAPISGALVIALWDLEGVNHMDTVGTLKVIEAVTDQGGAFRMPGWGPLPRPNRGVLDQYDPQLLVIKLGYDNKRVLNPSQPAGRRESIQVHDFARNGQSIALRKFDLKPQIYATDIGGLVTGGLLHEVLFKSCMWKEIPKTVRFLDEEGRRERAEKLQPFNQVSIDKLLARAECGPTDEFKKSLEEGR